MSFKETGRPTPRPVTLTRKIAEFYKPYIDALGVLKNGGETDIFPQAPTRVAVNLRMGSIRPLDDTTVDLPDGVLSGYQFQVDPTHPSSPMIVVLYDQQDPLRVDDATRIQRMYQGLDVQLIPISAHRRSRRVPKK